MFKRRLAPPQSIRRLGIHQETDIHRSSEAQVWECPPFPPAHSQANGIFGNIVVTIITLIYHITPIINTWRGLLTNSLRNFLVKGTALSVNIFLNILIKNIGKKVNKIIYI